DKPPAQDAKDWAFTIASVKDQNTMTMSYYAFKIDWGQVQANIAAGMKSEMNALAFLLPRSKVDIKLPSLDLAKFKDSGLMINRKQAIELSKLFPDTVAADALFVRLAYLALRLAPNSTIDASTAQDHILKAFGDDAKAPVTYRLLPLASPKGPPLKRKPR